MAFSSCLAAMSSELWLFRFVDGSPKGFQQRVSKGFFDRSLLGFQQRISKCFVNGSSKEFQQRISKGFQQKISKGFVDGSSKEFQQRISKNIPTEDLQRISVEVVFSSNWPQFSSSFDSTISETAEKILKISDLVEMGENGW